MPEREEEKYRYPKEPKVDFTAFEITETNQKNDYDETDMRYVLSQRDFDCWQDVVFWLKNFGVHDKELTPNEKKFLLSDIERLASQNHPFTKDEFQATQVAKSTRRHLEGINDEENI